MTHQQRSDAGATHPQLEESQGAAYRLSLQLRASGLGVTDHMVLHGRFVSAKLNLRHVQPLADKTGLLPRASLKAVELKAVELKAVELKAVEGRAQGRHHPCSPHSWTCPL
jgi:hypothetical protein